MLRNFLVDMMYRLAKLKYWNKLEQQCRDPRSSQQRLLQSILAEQADTGFGLKHGFSDISSYQDYVGQVGRLGTTSKRRLTVNHHAAGTAYG